MPENRHIFNKDNLFAFSFLAVFTLFSFFESFLQTQLRDIYFFKISYGIAFSLTMLYGLRISIAVFPLYFASFFYFFPLEYALRESVIYTISLLIGVSFFKQSEQRENIFFKSKRALRFVFAAVFASLGVLFGDILSEIFYTSSFSFESGLYQKFFSTLLGIFAGGFLPLSLYFYFSKEKIRFDFKIVLSLFFTLSLALLLYNKEYYPISHDKGLEYLFLIPLIFAVVWFKPIVFSLTVFLNAFLMGGGVVYNQDFNHFTDIVLVNTIFDAIFLVAITFGKREKKRAKGFIDLNNFQKVIDFVPLPIFFKDQRRNYIGTNKTFDIFVGENRRKTLNELIRLCQQNSLHKKFETKIIADNAKERDIVVHISFIYDDEGNQCGKMGIIFDISEQVKAKKTLEKWKDRYKIALDGANDGLWDWDFEKDEVTYSNRWKEIMGYGSKEVAKNIYTWLNLIVEEDKKKVLSELDRHLNGESDSFKVQHRIKMPDGSEKWVEVKAKAFFDSNGKVRRMAGFTTDITELKKIEIKLKESEALFRIFMDTVPGNVFIKDEKGRFVFVNEYMYKFFGFKDLLNKTISSVIQKDLAQKIEMEEKLVLVGQDLRVKEEKYFDANKKAYIFKTYRFPIIQDNKKFIGGISLDITKQKDFETKLNFLAHYDTLTSLPNRILFQDRLKHAIAYSKRYGKKIALMFLDLDNFKTVNDTLGHDYGDLLLVEISKRLKNSLREQDTVSRLGGDEFTIILEGIRDDVYTSVVAQKIIDVISQPLKLKDKTVYVGVSIGISIYPDDGRNMEELIKNADMAMYKAKESGKNNFQYFTEDMNQEYYRKLEITNGLRDAIKNNELYLLYQPKVDVKNRKIAGVEALVRWRHKELGNIPPQQFIDIAENSKLILELGEWILKKACLQARKWHVKGFRDIKIAVNFSINQLSQYGIVDTVENILQETKLDPSMLEIEIVENVLMKNVKKVEKTLKSLRRLGVTIAIDDFGTGYSSLSYLKRLPIHTLKIDRSFVKDVQIDSDDTQIVSAIIMMGKKLGLEIVAEGVETKEQLEFLKSQGCHLMQGYYFSEPVKEIEIEEMLDRYNTTFALDNNKIKRIVI